LCVTLQYKITFSILREDDESLDPVIFAWSPRTNAYSPSGLMLLHHTSSGLSPLDIDHTAFVSPSEEIPIVVDRNCAKFDASIRCMQRGEYYKYYTLLPERYQKGLLPGHTYTLLWPGSKITAWDWGTVESHAGLALPTQPAKPLILSGGAHLTFTAFEEFPLWLARDAHLARYGFDATNGAEADWRSRRAQRPKTYSLILPSERKPNAPKFSITLDCAAILRRDEDLDITVTLTYSAPASARAVTFHTYLLSHPDAYQLQRLIDGEWEICNDGSDGSDGCCGFRIVDDPDVALNVGTSEHFTSLSPGESWTTSQRLRSEELADEGLRDGEALRYVFSGVVLDWWDWGSKEEHVGTVVMVPCWVGAAVVEPRENEGRGELVVPASGVVEVVVGGEV
jgi:hypothetical protein